MLAAARGLVTESFALFRIAPQAWEAPAADSFALLLGSANALRHGGAALAGWRGKPAWCVGAATRARRRRWGWPSRGRAKAGCKRC
jgi:uroporphyrinogen-III synthase